MVPNFKFYEKRFLFFGISIALLLIGIIGFIINGVSLDIQFKGGAILKYTYTGTVDKAKAAEIVTQAAGRKADVQETVDLATKTKKMEFSLAGNAGLSATEQTKVDDALKAEFKDANFKLSDSNLVEPFIGKKFLMNGMWAIFWAIALIIIYIWIRFSIISGLSAGVMAVIGLLHDSLMILSVFIIFKIPLNDAFIAVILTILGYSINDTIVIYDRIRENARGMSSTKIVYEDMVDKSINQSLVRSVNTVLTVFISITIVYIFSVVYNIESIKNFALPMMIGIVSGAYSTIFVSGPLWVMWQKHKQKQKLEQKAAKAK